MKKLKSLMLILCLLNSLLISYAQTTLGINKKLDRHILNSNEGNFLDFKSDFETKPGKFFTEFADDYGLTKNDQIVAVKTETDQLGMTHIRHTQLYKGIQVEGGDYTLHTINDRIFRANGTIVKQLDLDVMPSITKEKAFNLAKEYVKAKEYGNELDPNFNPGKDLIITLTNENTQSKSIYVVAFRIGILTKNPFDHKLVYVDAHSGKILRSFSLIHSGCTPGTVNTFYNGTQNINTTFQSATNNYRLEEDCNSHRKIHTRVTVIDAPNTEIVDTDNNWGETNDTKTGGSVQWAIEKALDYFYNTFNRNSYDNLGATVDANIHNNGRGAMNAFWYPYNPITTYGDNSINYGDGDALHSLAALDISGHELTHAFSGSTANFATIGEANALNESFSDIFGACIEFYVKGSGGNYLIGEDVFSGGLRSLANPLSTGQADTYLVSPWYTGPDNDYFGHYNCGPQNYCFYLLSEGGPHMSNNRPVTGIGRAKAAAIFFRALTVYLHSSDGYVESRIACMNAASDLFGCGSPEFISTINAWYAIGLGSPAVVQTLTCGNPYGSGSYLQSPYNITTFGNLVSGNLAACGQDITVNSNGNLVIFQAYGSIKLTPGFSAKTNSIFSAKLLSCASFGAIGGSRISSDAIYSDDGSQESLEMEKILKIYPNPNDGTFRINFPSAEATYQVQISDMLGNIISNESISNTNAKAYTLSTLSNGIYIVNVTGNGLQKRTKVQVMR